MSTGKITHILDQTRDCNIGICFFPAMQAALMCKSNDWLHGFQYFQVYQYVTIYRRYFVLKFEYFHVYILYNIL